MFKVKVLNNVAPVLRAQVRMEMECLRLSALQVLKIL